jgi:4-hydroxybenzoate polyprenyltransferase
MKIISLFSVVRGYNISGYYLGAVPFGFIYFITRKGTLANLLDLNLFLLVLASSLSIASGYIINFYDSQKT